MILWYHCFRKYSKFEINQIFQDEIQIFSNEIFLIRKIFKYHFNGKLLIIMYHLRL